MSSNQDLFFNQGEVIFATDSPLDTAYFILEGEVNLSLVLNGKEVTIKIGPNQFIGDASVAFEQKAESKPMHYSAKAVAVNEVKAVPIPISDIKSELEQCPAMIKAWIASFLKRTIILVDALISEKAD